MAFLAGLAPIASALFGGVGALISSGILGGHKKPPVLQPRAVTTNADVTQAEADDALRQRRGAAADMITGTRGADAAAGSVGRLVAGS